MEIVLDADGSEAWGGGGGGGRWGRSRRSCATLRSSGDGCEEREGGDDDSGDHVDDLRGVEDFWEIICDLRGNIWV